MVILRLFSNKTVLLLHYML